MTPCFSSGMPIPVSCTEKHSRASRAVCNSAPTRTATSPCSVNLMALPIRLTSTCLRRTGSPTSSSGTLGSNKHFSFRPFCRAWKLSPFTISATHSRKLNSTFSSSTFPASIFEKSRMSLMIAIRELAEAPTMPRYSRCSGLTGVSRSSCAIPIIPFIGVLIS